MRWAAQVVTGPVEQTAQPTAAPARTEVPALSMVDPSDRHIATAAAEPAEVGGDAGPPDAPPPAWVAAVRALIDEHPDLPVLLDGDPAAAQSSRGRWALHPWLVCRDLRALLAWAEHLDETVSVYRSGPDNLVHVCGLVAGYPTALVGHSRLLPGAPAVLDLALLQSLRDDEDDRQLHGEPAPSRSASAAWFGDIATGGIR